VNGTIDEILVNEGEKVKRGDLLVSMDARQIRQRIIGIEAELEGAKARKDKLAAEKLALELNLNSRIATKTEQITALMVELETLIDRHRLATKKLKRSKFLVSKNLTSQKNLENVQDIVIELKGQIRAAKAQIKVSEFETKEIEAGKADLAIVDEDVRISSITIKRLRARRGELEVELAERLIYSPTDGVIDRIFKNPGEYVEDADELLILHDPDNIWIEANIVEDQIRHLQIGQPVKLHLNAYPFEMFRGQVTGIGRVTLTNLLASKAGSVDTRARKVAQRIPVQIKFLDKPKITAPGMLVEVNIQIQDRNISK
tara:strand:+ start:2323 stop:3267 length:945 start_codon:yes stop_codon:yes gene_type:complete